MLTQSATVKTRLAIAVPDYDDLLTSAIRAVSARFGKETNRTLARAVSTTDEFDSASTEVAVSCYPIASVTKFELKSNETDGWTEQTGVQYESSHFTAYRRTFRLGAWDLGLGICLRFGIWILGFSECCVPCIRPPPFFSLKAVDKR